MKTLVDINMSHQPMQIAVDIKSKNASAATSSRGSLKSGKHVSTDSDSQASKRSIQHSGNITKRYVVRKNSDNAPVFPAIQTDPEVLSEMKVAGSPQKIELNPMYRLRRDLVPKIAEDTELINVTSVTRGKVGDNRNTAEIIADALKTGTQMMLSRDGRTMSMSNHITLSGHKKPVVKGDVHNYVPTPTLAGSDNQMKMDIDNSSTSGSVDTKGSVGKDNKIKNSHSNSQDIINHANEASDANVVQPVYSTSALKILNASESNLPHFTANRLGGDQQNRAMTPGLEHTIRLRKYKLGMAPVTKIKTLQVELEKNSNIYEYMSRVMQADERSKRNSMRSMNDSPTTAHEKLNRRASNGAMSKLSNNSNNERSPSPQIPHAVDVNEGVVGGDSKISIPESFQVDEDASSLDSMRPMSSLRKELLEHRAVSPDEISNDPAVFASVALSPVNDSITGHGSVQSIKNEVSGHAPRSDGRASPNSPGDSKNDKLITTHPKFAKLYTSMEQPKEVVVQQTAPKENKLIHSLYLKQPTPQSAHKPRHKDDDPFYSPSKFRLPTQYIEPDAAASRGGGFGTLQRSMSKLTLNVKERSESLSRLHSSRASLSRNNSMDSDTEIKLNDLHGYNSLAEYNAAMRAQELEAKQHWGNVDGMSAKEYLKMTQNEIHKRARTAGTRANPEHMDMYGTTQKPSSAGNTGGKRTLTVPSSGGADNVSLVTAIPGGALDDISVEEREHEIAHRKEAEAVAKPQDFVVLNATGKAVEFTVYTCNCCLRKAVLWCPCCRFPYCYRCWGKVAHHSTVDSSNLLVKLVETEYSKHQDYHFDPLILTSEGKIVPIDVERNLFDGVGGASGGGSSFFTNWGGSQDGGSVSLLGSDEDFDINGEEDYMDKVTKSQLTGSHKTKMPRNILSAIGSQRKCKNNLVSGNTGIPATGGRPILQSPNKPISKNPMERFILSRSPSLDTGMSGSLYAAPPSLSGSYVVPNSTTGKAAGEYGAATPKSRVGTANSSLDGISLPATARSIGSRLVSCASSERGMLTDLKGVDEAAPQTHLNSSVASDWIGLELQNSIHNSSVDSGGSGFRTLQEAGASLLSPEGIFEGFQRTASVKEHEGKSRCVNGFRKKHNARHLIPITAQHPRNMVAQGATPCGTQLQNMSRAFSPPAPQSRSGHSATEKSGSRPGSRTDSYHPVHLKKYDNGFVEAEVERAYANSLTGDKVVFEPRQSYMNELKGSMKKEYMSYKHKQEMAKHQVNHRYAFVNGQEVRVVGDEHQLHHHIHNHNHAINIEDETTRSMISNDLTRMTDNTSPAGGTTDSNIHTKSEILQMDDNL